MKVHIRDEEALASLTSAHLRAYLETRGWGNPRPWGQWGTIFSKEQEGKLWEIAILLRDDGFGYAKFMAQIVATLAEAEDRSQLDVFYDLANAKSSAQFQDSHEGVDKTTKVWCVRAQHGKYAVQFTTGGFAAIGWLPQVDLSTTAKDRPEIRRLYQETYRQAKKKKVDTDVGQISRFLLKMKVGDFIITPAEDPSQLWYGRVTTKPYYDPDSEDIRHHGQPWPHRRKVDWARHTLDRNKFPTPLQNAMKHAQLTVFQVKHREEFLGTVVNALWSIGRWSAAD